jgi:hypothetical protein
MFELAQAKSLKMLILRARWVKERWGGRRDDLLDDPRLDFPGVEFHLYHVSGFWGSRRPVSLWAGRFAPLPARWRLARQAVWPLPGQTLVKTAWSRRRVQLLCARSCPRTRWYATRRRVRTRSTGRLSAKAKRQSSTDYTMNPSDRVCRNANSLCRSISTLELTCK